MNLLPYHPKTNLNNALSEESIETVNLHEIYQNTPIKLLVCDDNELDRELLHRSLRNSKLDFDIISCCTGDEALEILSTRNIDCILLDYQLPDMTGLELLLDINHKFKTQAPTIMITGMGNEAIAVQLMHAGAYDYLNKKQISPATLSNAIEIVLKRFILEKRLAASQEKIRHMSLHDELTGLPNRHQFFSALEHSIIDAARTNSSFSLFMLDLDLFKKVNDSMGHLAGDTVLKVIAERLSGLIRKSDIVARIGGDEFAILLHGTLAQEDITTFCEKIVNTIGQPIVVLDNNLAQVGISIGIANYPVHGNNSTSLLCNADYAMYLAKNNTCNFISLEQNDNTTRYQNVNISKELPQAMEQHQLYLAYQPKINLSDNSLQGVEALIRWRGATGLISPQFFIPTVERTQLIDSLTHFTVLQAFQQYQLWYSNGYKIPISINISAKMLDKLEFVEWFLERVKEFNIHPENITLEITETALSSSSIKAKKIINQFLDSGFKVSIDDFGSGYTSFRYIRDIAISEIKIDQTYTQELEQSARARSIVRSLSILADELAIKIVAEGVEHKNSSNILKDLGCTCGQGFYFARPMSGTQISEWIRPK